MPGRAPAFRPYRFTLWLIYFGLIAVMVTLMVMSVARTLRGTDRPRSNSGALPTRAALRVCVTDLESLYREQNRHAWAFGDELDPKDPLVGWGTWSHRWEEQVEDLSDRCLLDETHPGEEGASERNELAKARDAMLELHRAYGIQLNRFADEYRDLTRTAVEALTSAHQAISGQQ